MSLPKYSHPGDGYMYVICDVCGRKVRQRDTVLITDRFNTLNNRVVCRDDVDKTNPQATPIIARETLRPDPRTIRSEPADRYVTYPNSTIVPSAPRMLTVYPSGIGTTLLVSWTAPENSGDSPIIGYKITRSEPQLTTQFTLIDNTGTNSTLYEDTEDDITGNYTFRVAAINSAGTGPYSALYNYPTDVVTSADQFILTDDTEYVIMTDDTDLYLEMDS